MNRQVGGLWPTVLLLLASCGGGDGPPTGPGGGDGSLTLDADHAVSDLVGPQGDTLRTTAGGHNFTLIVPPGALQASVTITMTPIASWNDLPLSGGLAAGVSFEPAGLQFVVPALLTVSNMPGAPSGMRLSAVTFEADGDSLALRPVLGTASVPSILVSHFSGGSFGFGTLADLERISIASPAAALSEDSLALLASPETPADSGAIVDLLTAWFDSVVLPGISAAANDAGLLAAVRDYGLWVETAQALLTGNIPLSPIGAQLPRAPDKLRVSWERAREAMAPQLRDAIAGNNSTCRTDHSVQALYNVFFWQGMAHIVNLEIETADQQLDLASVVSNLCARIVADSVGLPDPLPLGADESLDLAWGLLIGETPPVVPADFQVTVTANGATVQHPTGFTGPDPLGGPITRGFYTTVVRAEAAGASFTGTACFAPSDTTVVEAFCGATTIDRGASGPPPGVRPYLIQVYLLAGATEAETAVDALPVHLAAGATDFTGAWSGDQLTWAGSMTGAAGRGAAYLTIRMIPDRRMSITVAALSDWMPSEADGGTTVAQVQRWSDSLVLVSTTQKRDGSIEGSFPPVSMDVEAGDTVQLSLQCLVVGDEVGHGHEFGTGLCATATFSDPR